VHAGLELEFVEDQPELLFLGFVEVSRIVPVSATVGHGRDLFMEALAEYPVKELVESLTLPPSVHIGLSDTEMRLCEDSFAEPVVEYPYIPGVGSVDGNTGTLQKRTELLPEIGFCHVKS